MTKWNKHSFGHVGKQISKLQRKLQLLENMRGGESTLEDIHAIKELNRWLYMEEDMWHQRSRNNWLSVGDKNTTFFHTKASNQWQRNSINRVLDSNNTWQEDEEKIGKTFVNYYEQQFLSSRPIVEEELLEAIHTKVTDRMNASLLRNFNAQEVEKALQQMHPLKAPGLDGMPPLFYQHFWPMVKSIVITSALDFLNYGIAPPHFNDTHIVPIPKTKNPERVTDYRPISLCNVAYKLDSKVVANRMKFVF